MTTGLILLGSFVLLCALDLVWVKACRTCEEDGVIDLSGQE